MYFYFSCFALSVIRVSASNEDIFVGGIYDTQNEKTQIAFIAALDLINNQEILNRFRLVPILEQIHLDNSLDASQAACKLLAGSVVGIFGPGNDYNAMGVQSVCDKKHVPHIETRYNSNQIRGACLINLYPHPNSLAKIFVDIVQAWEWKSFAILFESYESFSRIGNLLKMYDHHGYAVVVRELDIHRTGNYRTVLKEAMDSGETHFILDCSIDILEEVLRQAQQIGLMSKNYNYIITNMDMHTIDMVPYQYSGTNINGIRLVDPEDNYVIETEGALENQLKMNEMKYDEVQHLPTRKMKVETALTVDAVILLAHALRVLENINDFNVHPLFCNSTDSWEDGSIVTNMMKSVPTSGLTGFVKFDNQGFRTDFSMDVIELKEEGIVKIGIWNATDGLYITGMTSPMDHGNEISLKDKTFTVITVLTPPYGRFKESQNFLFGNERFEGFAIDLIHELSLMEGFNYTFIIREDKSNGAKDRATGRWSGMIGDLMAHAADLAISDLTITSEREEAVDFTAPFMISGISILYKQPDIRAARNFFAFAKPFTVEVWLWIAGAYFIVSISFFIMGRLCRSEWTNPFPCTKNPKFVVNQFNLRNSFWFSFGSLMQSRTGIAPIAVSTRITTFFWWFFTLIMVSSYTANLAALLITEKPPELPDLPFKNVHELVARAEEYGIKYGALLNGATANFFKNSYLQEYQQIYEYMDKNKHDVMEYSSQLGVLRVRKENYAFFMESPLIEYEIERHCELTQVGGLLNEEGYGIAMRKNSMYRNTLSRAVLKLKESGKIAALKRKWWEELDGGAQCTTEADSQEAKPFNMKNFEGIFWITIAGALLGCVCVLFERVLHALKKSIKHEETSVEKLKDDNVKPERNEEESKTPESSHKAEDI